MFEAIVSIHGVRTELGTFDTAGAADSCASACACAIAAACGVDVPTIITRDSNRRGGYTGEPIHVVDGIGFTTYYRVND